MRIHLIVGGAVLLATLYLRLQRVYVVCVIVLVAFVIALELLNTAIESVVDLMTVAHHPLAKIAKDTAAGAVLVATIASVIVGYLIFYEGITANANRVYTAVARRHRTSSSSASRSSRSGRSSRRPTSVAGHLFRAAPSRDTPRSASPELP